MKKPTELRNERVEKLIEDCRAEVISNLLGPFGLCPSMFKDKEGGNVTTTSNFEKGITATKADRQKYNDWIRSNKEFDRSQFSSSSDNRKKYFQQNESVKDKYTGKSLPKDGRTQFDHVVSLKKISEDSKSYLFLNEKQRKEMANSPKNLVPTHQSINSSKQDKDLEDWANAPGKKERFDLNPEMVSKANNEAKGHINQTVLKQQLLKQGRELFITGGTDALKMGSREALGMVLAEVVNGVFSETKDLVMNGNKNDLTLMEDLKCRLNKISLQVLENSKHLVTAFKEGALAAFISNLVTFMINNLVRTSAQMVRMVRESFLALIKAIKLMLYPPDGMDSNEAFREATKTIAGVVGLITGIALEEVIKAFVMNIPPFSPYAGEVAGVVAGTISGIGTALVFYLIDRLFDRLENPYSLQMLDSLIQNQVQQQELCNHLFNLVNKQMILMENNQHLAVGYSQQGILYQQQSLSIELIRRSSDKQQNSTAKMLDSIKAAVEKGRADQELISQELNQWDEENEEKE